MFEKNIIENVPTVRAAWRSPSSFVNVLIITLRSINSSGVASGWAGVMVEP